MDELVWRSRHRRLWSQLCSCNPDHHHYLHLKENPSIVHVNLSSHSGCTMPSLMTSLPLSHLETINRIPLLRTEWSGAGVNTPGRDSLVCEPPVWNSELGITPVTVVVFFIIYFILNGSKIYKKDTMPYWRRLETRDWDHKHLRKLFIEVINQARSRVIFS